MSFQNMLTQILNFFVELHAPSGFEHPTPPPPQPHPPHTLMRVKSAIWAEAHWQDFAENEFYFPAK